jgi:hypothetical protein
MVHAQGYSKVRGHVKQAARCRTSQEATTTQRTGTDAGNGFLKTKFQPLREDKYPFLNNRMLMEREFFNSLSNLCGLYGFETGDAATHPCPLNIAMAYRQAKDQLQQVNKELQLVIVQDETHNACLATVETYPIGLTLFYIPVRPLLTLLQRREEPALAGLLLAVFRYLHTSAGIPWFYRHGGFLEGCYEMLKEWYLESYAEEEEQTGVKEIIDEYQQMEQGAQFLYKMVRKPICIKEIKNRVRRFRPQTAVDIEVLKIASTVAKLMKTYPDQDILESIPVEFLNPEAGERIFPENYLSFFWDGGGQLNDDLMRYVNDHLQECSEIDEPVSIQFFDRPQNKPTHDLNFEKTLFRLIDDLCTVLNQLI